MPSSGMIEHGPKPPLDHDGRLVCHRHRRDWWRDAVGIEGKAHPGRFQPQCPAESPHAARGANWRWQPHPSGGQPRAQGRQNAGGPRLGEPDPGVAIDGAGADQTRAETPEAGWVSARGAERARISRRPRRPQEVSGRTHEPGDFCRREDHRQPARIYQTARLSGRQLAQDGVQDGASACGGAQTGAVAFDHAQLFQMRYHLRINRLTRKR